MQHALIMFPLLCNFSPLPEYKIILSFDLYLSLMFLQLFAKTVNLLLIVQIWVALMAQLVKGPSLGFGLGHDLRVIGLSPASGSVLSGESA